MKGKIQLPKLSSPPEPLWSMYFDKKNESYKNFRENIRSYNNMFSFTSMGGKIDHGLNAGHGPYTFVLSGTNYHSIGNLVPPVGQPPVFSQMYIYDTENEVSNRISAVRYGIKNFHALFTLISSLALVLRIMYVHFFQQAFGGHNNRSMCR